ncbi:pyruvate dehydrogenase [Candidatus Poribacteria bacterium]|nr:pyruvate dehydrogenase [Candidatus Poribacteria bacterium]
MVKKLDVLAEFKPTFIERDIKIPVFQYTKTLKEELDEGNITEDQCFDMLDCMLLIRNLEEMIVELKETKGRYGPLRQFLYVGASHVSIGQEAVSTGGISGIAPTDYITSTHRGHGDSLAKGYFAIKSMSDDELIGRFEDVPEMCEYLEIDYSNKDRDNLVMESIKLHLYRAITELFGSEHGYCHGRGGGMHIADFSVGHLGANAIVGGSIGMATGAAMSARYLDNGKIVLCFAGDGAYNNGIAHESMNFAAQAQFSNGLMPKKMGIPIIFAIVNNQYGMTGQQRGEVTNIDFLAERGFGYNEEAMHAEVINGMDILAVMDGTKRAAELARKGEGPILVEYWTCRYKGHSLSDDTKAYRSDEEFESWSCVDPLLSLSNKMIDAGLLTADEYAELRQKARKRNEDMALKASKAPLPDPKAMYFGLFSDTTSEEVPEEYQEVETLKEYKHFEREDGKITYREAVIEALAEEMLRDNRVMIYGEDIAEYGGAFGATEGLIDIFGRGRVFNTPISESAIIGTGVGAAMTGTRPIVELMYIDFILQTMCQTGNQAAKWKYMSGGQPTIPLTIRTTTGGGKGYAGQHSQSLEAIVAHMAGLKVVMPSTAYDAKGLLKTAIRDDNPVVFIEHQNLYKDPVGASEVPESEYLIPLGKADVKRRIDTTIDDGPCATVVTWGYMVPIALYAAEQMAKNGIELEVVDLRTLVPMDIETVIESVKKTGHAAVLYQACEFMGFGAEVVSQIQHEAFDYLDAPVLRIAAPNTPPPSSQILEKAFLPDPDRIVASIKEMF